MSKKDPETRRVIMARSVARRWLQSVAQAEYRIRVLYGSREYRNLPNLLRAFRDGKVALQGLPSVSDLGVKEDFDAVEVWSKNYDALRKLCAWFEKQGFDTTGIW